MCAWYSYKPCSHTHLYPSYDPRLATHEVNQSLATGLYIFHFAEHANNVYIHS